MKRCYALFFSVLIFAGCVTNPVTGKSSLALISNDELFSIAFTDYEEFKKENKVVTGTAQAQMVERVGQRIRVAAEKWYASQGYPDYFKDFQWEFALADDETVNAWAMPGGKIMFYTGILDFMNNNEDEVATVMGHEIAHAMLGHSQKRMSEALLQAYGVATISALFNSPDLLTAGMMIATNLFIALPNSRQDEFEADEYGLYLMAIAGYNPDAAGPLWDRMSGDESINLSFFSTHPYSPERASRLRELVPEANRIKGEIGVIR
jgi:predicted Zn-dependent protease